jgi:hypothetical protein
LGTINLLNLVEQVLLHGFFATDSKDIVRNERTFDQGLPRFDGVPRVNEESLSWWNQVFDLFTTFAAHEDGTFSAFAVLGDFDQAVEFGNNGWIFGFASLKDFRDPWKTPGDILNACGFARHFG